MSVFNEKGVVQLFNAVSLQQKTMKNKLRETRRSEFKKDKVLHKTKEIFDSAMEKSRNPGKKPKPDYHSSSDDDVEIKDEGDDSDDPIPESRKRSSSKNKKPAFQALHDDYMLNAKVKDWDQSSDKDE